MWCQLSLCVVEMITIEFGNKRTCVQSDFVYVSGGLEENIFDTSSASQAVPVQLRGSGGWESASGPTFLLWILQHSGDTSSPGIGLTHIYQRGRTKDMLCYVCVPHNSWDQHKPYDHHDMGNFYFFFTYAAAFDPNEMSKQATLFLYACLFTFNDNVLFNVIPIYGRCDKLHLMGINEQLVIRQGGQALLYRKGLMLFEWQKCLECFNFAVFILLCVLRKLTQLTVLIVVRFISAKSHHFETKFF